MPNGVSAIGGVCGDPRGVAAVWVAALDGALFCVTPDRGEWHWEHLAKRWPTGGCGFSMPWWPRHRCWDPVPADFTHSQSGGSDLHRCSPDSLAVV